MTSSGFPWGIYEKIAHQILHHYHYRARKIESLVVVNVCAVVVRITTLRDGGTSSSAAIRSANSWSDAGKQPNVSDAYARPIKGGNVTTSASADWLNNSAVTKPRNPNNQ